MQEEILNIEYHKVRLIVKSLNLSKDRKEASNMCGISLKSIYQYMRIYDIVKVDNKWIQKRKIIVNI